MDIKTRGMRGVYVSDSGREVENKMMQKRVEWIDCAKLIAIMAVVTDHCNGFLYTKPLIANASCFSVSLFVLLAGISIWIAYERGKEISFASQLRKVEKIFLAYAVATFVVLCIMQRRFDLKTYLSYLISFNIQGPYYYLVFFIQLLLVAPLLVHWCELVNSRKHKWIWHLGTTCFLGWFAFISINYTYILPVHGGGQFLGGGTYVILYYLGMLLTSIGMFEQSRNRRVFIAVFCSGLSVLWVFLMTEGKLPFDEWMNPYWGDGFNPPSINFMVYALFMLLICYSLFSLLGDCRYKLIRQIISLLCFLGKNTLYIWLYHLSVGSFFAARFPSLRDKNILIRLVVFSIIVILPAIIIQLVFKLCNFCYKQIWKMENADQ